MIRHIKKRRCEVSASFDQAALAKGYLKSRRADRSRYTALSLLGRAVCWSSLVIAASPAAAYMAYVSNEKGNTVTIIDTDKMEVVKTIKVGQRPRGIAMSKNGQFVVVALGDDDTVQIIDTKTQEVTGTLPSGPDPELFTFDPTGRYL
jgi:YVTN family beta-propeller protein